MSDCQNFHTLLQQDARTRSGLDPDFYYSPHRFATTAAFKKNVPHFISKVGIDFVGFVFLSFPRSISLADARICFNTIWRRFFRSLFGHWVSVVELTEKGRFHFHLLVECLVNIRSGFDFTFYKKYVSNARSGSSGGQRMTLKERREMRDAIPANDQLRGLWHALDAGVTKFGFGRAWDLFPIETNAAAVASYLSKDFLASVPRLPDAKRLITYSRGFPRAVPPGWRPKSNWFEKRLGALLRVFGLSDRDQLKQRLGPRWAYAILELIHRLESDRAETWPNLLPYQLAPIVRDLIRADGRLEHYLGTLLPAVEEVVQATSLPSGPPPPPGSAPPYDPHCFTI